MICFYGLSAKIEIHFKVTITDEKLSYKVVNKFSIQVEEGSFRVKSDIVCLLFCCTLEQLWDLRTKTAVMDMKENEDYISDLAVDDQQKFLLATR